MDANGRAAVRACLATGQALSLLEDVFKGMDHESLGDVRGLLTFYRWRTRDRPVAGSLSALSWEDLGERRGPVADWTDDQVRNALDRNRGWPGDGERWKTRVKHLEHELRLRGLTP